MCRFQVRSTDVQCLSLILTPGVISASTLSSWCTKCSCIPAHSSPNACQTIDSVLLCVDAVLKSVANDLQALVLWMSPHQVPACDCAADVLLPPAVVQYLPNFFFGALLVVFGIEIAGDWLVRSYAKVTRAEYVLLLLTFIAIMELELEMGVAAGILMCTIYFAFTYARVSGYTGPPCPGNMQHSAVECTQLQAQLHTALVVACARLAWDP